jgi:hypothetical protein
MTDLVSVPKATLQRALEALSFSCPAPDLMSKHNAAESALRAALERPEQEPYWLTKELMADYFDMIAEAIEENRSEMLRHKAHWMRTRGET